jgi:hypothetical protein
VEGTVPGSAWQVQLDRMSAGIYFPLYLVLVAPHEEFSIFYLSAASPANLCQKQQSAPDGRASSTTYARYRRVQW